MATSWATVEDLYARFGDEFMDKLATRRVWDRDLETYVADECKTARNDVIQLALDDAKGLILYKISCSYSNGLLLNDSEFKIIKSWHIKLAIEALKIGGDCMACVECNAQFDAFLKCGSICNNNGECLLSNSTFFSVSEAEFCCEHHGRGCKCC